jgi:hypothetical protein
MQNWEDEMGHEKMKRVVSMVLAGLIAAIASGCGGASNGDNSRYVPSERSARAALDAALSAWQRGESAGKLASTSPTIEVVDTKRPEGQKLARFEIIKEEPGDGPRWFTVRLVLEPQGESEARYVVIGNDPIWVFRDSDYATVETM